MVLGVVDASKGIPPPHGGRLVDRVARGSFRERLLSEAGELPKITLSEELVKEVENIAYGVFSPLEGFLTREEYLSVLSERRLSSGLPWTIPIVLDVDSRVLSGLREGDVAALVSSEGSLVGVVEVEEIYQFDSRHLAERVYGTVEEAHPGVARVLTMKDRLVGGKVWLLNESRDQFSAYRMTPAETRSIIAERGWRTLVGFQTRNIPHMGHEYIQKVVLTLFDAIFINPLIGRKKRGDFRDEVIVETYRILIEKYHNADRVLFGILRTEMRYAGPVEAIFHAIVRKNFGCSHFIVGRDHAGIGNYYPPYEAQRIFEEFPDLGITPIPFPEVWYCRSCGSVTNAKACPHGADSRIEFSGTRLREALRRAEEPPRELLREEIYEVLLRSERIFVE